MLANKIATTVLILFVFQFTNGQQRARTIEKEAWKFVIDGLSSPSDEYRKADSTGRVARVYTHYSKILIDSSRVVGGVDARDLLIAARKNLDTALIYEKDLRTANVLAGNICIMLDSDYIRAATYYNRNLAKNPHYFDSHFNLGIVSEHFKKYDEAIGYYLKAYSDDSSNAAAGAIGECYNYEDSLDQALYWLRIAIRINNANDDAYYTMGLIYGKKKGNLPEAINYIKNALLFNPYKKIYYEDLGVAYGMNGEYQNSVDVTLRGIMYFPDYAPLFQALHLSYKNLHKTKKAQAAFNKAKELDPEKYGSTEY
ncbi:MAG: Tetratricopeptide 2 repeat-containing protein [Bacteroidota bacterium]|nr:Tetratricopeptide 2 repeat-containing protein [Bacteroidota bacterium]